MRQIALYIYGKFGRRERVQFLERVKETEELLRHNPNIGIIDPLFDDRPITYRSVIIYGRSKMVYWVKDEIITIVAFWDTRCEPQRQADKHKQPCGQMKI